MLTREFFRPVSGPCIFTIALPQTLVDSGHPPHYTFRINRKEASGSWPEAFFISLLTGRDNENDYTYLGMFSPNNGNVRTTAKSRFSADSFPVRLLQRTIARIFADDTEPIERAGFRVHHEGKCGRCGRMLTVPESIERGIGPECAKK